jgi:hypothetical protein
LSSLAYLTINTRAPLCYNFINLAGNAPTEEAPATESVFSTVNRKKKKKKKRWLLMFYR